MAASGPRGAVSLKILVVGLLILGCAGITYYCHLVQEQEIVYTHLFYLPITLAGVWWGRKAVYLAGLLSVNLVASHLMAFGLNQNLPDELLRASMFIVVGYVVGVVTERGARLQVQALDEKRRRLKEAENHLRYVQRVAHELRNPLQVSMGALDSLEFGEVGAGDRELLELLNKSTERIGSRIRDLTGDEPYQETAGR